MVFPKRSLISELILWMLVPGWGNHPWYMWWLLRSLLPWCSYWTSTTRATLTVSNAQWTPKSGWSVICYRSSKSRRGHFRWREEFWRLRWMASESWRFHVRSQWDIVKCVAHIGVWPVYVTGYWMNLRISRVNLRTLLRPCTNNRF